MEYDYDEDEAIERNKQKLRKMDTNDIIEEIRTLRDRLALLAYEMGDRNRLSVGDFVLYRRNIDCKKGRKETTMTCPGFIGFTSGRLAWVYTLDKYNEKDVSEKRSIKIINTAYDYDDYKIVSENEVELEYVRINGKSWRIKC